jgi:hypothetical protein
MPEELDPITLEEARTVARNAIRRVFKLYPRGGPRPQFHTAKYAVICAAVEARGGWDAVFAHCCRGPADVCAVCGIDLFATHVAVCLAAHDAETILRHDVPTGVAILVRDIVQTELYPNPHVN